MEQQYGGGKWAAPANSGGGGAGAGHEFQYNNNQQFQQSHLQQHSPLNSQSQHSHPPQHPSLASHFHLSPLVERLANGIETGSRDQHFDALVDELSNQFMRCQQLLNSISGTMSSKSMTVEWQKRILEETMQQLNKRRDLMAKYGSSVEEVIKPNNF